LDTPHRSISPRAGPEGREKQVSPFAWLLDSEGLRGSSHRPCLPLGKLAHIPTEGIILKSDIGKWEQVYIYKLSHSQSRPRWWVPNMAFGGRPSASSSAPNSVARSLASFKRGPLCGRVGCSWAICGADCTAGLAGGVCASLTLVHLMVPGWGFSL